MLIGGGTQCGSVHIRTTTITTTTTNPNQVRTAPRRGDCVVFHSMVGDGSVNWASWHGGTSVSGASDVGKWTVQLFGSLPTAVRDDPARTAAFLAARGVP